MNFKRQLGKTTFLITSLVLASFATTAALTPTVDEVEATEAKETRPKSLVGTKIHGELAFTVTPEIQKYLDYYTANRKGRGVAIRGINRSNALREEAERMFREEGVPPQLVWLAQAESGWRPEAVSPVGAAGIWQFMPATGVRFGLAKDEAGDERLEFTKSTRAAAKYLKILSKRYDGNWLLAIGAYNCGEGNMDKAIERAGGVKDFWKLREKGVLPTETANYVPSVLAASIFGTDPATFGLDGRDAVSMKLEGRTVEPEPKEVLAVSARPEPKKESVRGTRRDAPRAALASRSKGPRDSQRSKSSSRNAR